MPSHVEARALAVQRDMLSELVEHDRRQQMRAEEAARRGMERRGRLADRLAIPARELLPHRLDHLEAARDLLERFRHVLAQLRQPCAAATPADRRRLNHDTLALNVIRKGFAHRALAGEGAHGLRFRRCRFSRQFILGRRRHQFFELQFQLVDQPLGALTAWAMLLALEFADLQLQIRDQRFGAGQPRLRIGGVGDRRIALGLAAQPCLALGQQRGLGAGKVRRQRERCR